LVSWKNVCLELWHTLGKYIPYIWAKSCRWTSPLGRKMSKEANKAGLMEIVSWWFYCPFMCRTGIVYTFRFIPAMPLHAVAIFSRTDT